LVKYETRKILASSSWDGLVKIVSPLHLRSATLLSQLSYLVSCSGLPERPTSTQILSLLTKLAFIKHYSLLTPPSSSLHALQTEPLGCSICGKHPLPVNPSIPQPARNREQVTRPVMVVPAHATEVLSLDWNKYRPWGSLPPVALTNPIKIWDCRSVKAWCAGYGVGAACEISLQGHEYAVRKVQCPPHRADVLSSASLRYDMSSVSPASNMAASADCLVSIGVCLGVDHAKTHIFQHYRRHPRLPYRNLFAAVRVGLCVRRVDLLHRVAGTIPVQIFQGPTLVHAGIVPSCKL